VCTLSAHYLLTGLRERQLLAVSVLKDDLVRVHLVGLRARARARARVKDDLVRVHLVGLRARARARARVKDGLVRVHLVGLRARARVRVKDGLVRLHLHLLLDEAEQVLLVGRGVERQGVDLAYVVKVAVRHCALLSHLCRPVLHDVH